MGLNAFLISLPAIIALAFKGGIFAYAHFSRTHNAQTRIYLYFLFALSIQNVAEIWHVHNLIDNNTLPYIEATIYYAAGIVGFALLFHLVVSLAFDQHNMWRMRLTLTAVYSYAIVLEILLLFTPWLVNDFVRFEYSVTRASGPLYFVFEFYAIGIFLSVIGILVYGSIYQYTSQKRAKNSVLLVAIIPMALVMLTVLILLRLGIGWFNAAVTFPIAITYFLVVTAYAIHQHRLFDIQFYIPWSKVRKRKTAFYHRIRAMITEIADLDSVNEAVTRLAETLRCPVALLGNQGAVLATAGASKRMVQIPDEALQSFAHIIVANEIVDTSPKTHALMNHHGVAAIVPFYPHSRNASGWLLLGDSFSEQVYTPFDFRVVEQLFDKMADLFLDKLLTMRAHAHDQIHALERQLQKTEHALTCLWREVDVLRNENMRLASEQPTDGLTTGASAIAGETFGPTVTLLGRDKTMLKHLRKHFPQVAHFVGPGSAGFKRHSAPDVLVCLIEAGTPAVHRSKLLKMIHENHVAIAVLVYGPGASEFVSKHKRNLLGSLIEVLPGELTEAVLTRKIRAMVELQKSVRAIHNPDYPLIAHSQVFTELLDCAERIAGFKEPVLIESKDVHEAIELARYMYGCSGNDGKFSVLTTAELENKTVLARQVGFTELLADARDGTLMIDNLRRLPALQQDELRIAIPHAGRVRVIAGCDNNADEVSVRLQQLAASSKPFVLVIPTMRERKLDIPLLVHYYTLQFNLQAGTYHYLSQSEADDLLAEDFPADMAVLKSSVFSRLQSKQPQPQKLPELDYAVTEKSLGQHVSEFEARLIAQTLERCDGNKSKAARLLGLRPNTLHYKIERLGSRRAKRR
ncbi:MAG: helix-turn-helix domain-containing protein [Acidiferrobacterales bacterium]